MFTHSRKAADFCTEDSEYLDFNKFHPHAVEISQRCGFLNQQSVNFCCRYSTDLLKIFPVDTNGEDEIHSQILALRILLWITCGKSSGTDNRIKSQQIHHT